MTSIRSQHGRALDAKLAAHRARLLDDLAAGTLPDYPMYRQIVGRLEGLADAAKLSEEADFEINGGEN